MTSDTNLTLNSWINTRITGILSMPEGSAQRALLARLRRGVGKAPGELPELWGVLFEGFPDKWMSGSGQATRSEWAAYIALTLFALHQQSKDPKTAPMHRKGQSLGRALNRLAGGDDEEKERILRRFRQLAAAAEKLPSLAMARMYSMSFNCMILTPFYKIRHHALQTFFIEFIYKSSK